MKIIDHQNTKIIATLGPASESEEVLTSLMREGVDIFRVNFSHGDHKWHKEIIDRIHMLNKKYNLHIGILCDLQGPKIRVGKMENDGLDIAPGDKLTFVTKKCIGTKKEIYISYQQFAADVSPGEKLLVDDGKIVLKVLTTDKKSKVEVVVMHGHRLSSNKGVNLPDTEISLPSITEKDEKDLAFILKQDIHWIALSFVRSAQDIKDLKKRISSHGHVAKVIAKIEKPEAVRNIKEIIKATDAIMVARGDLGVEVPMATVPNIQKSIIKRCIQKSKPVIVATQMMDSMITNINPTRAEVTDVANAVLDGTDAVMLSGETSVGDHPVAVVTAMNKIIEEAEKHYELQNKRPKPDSKSETFYSDVICFNAAKTSNDIKAKAIVGMTASGYTAYKISSYRPDAPIYIFAHNKEMLSILNLVWGVRCFQYNDFNSTDETISDIVEFLKNKKLVKIGDVIVNTGSMPIEKRFRTNMLKLTIIE